MGLARYLSKLAALVGSDGKVPAAGISDGAITNAKLGTDLDASKLVAGTLPIARMAAGAILNVTVLRAPTADVAVTSAAGANLIDQTVSVKRANSKLLLLTHSGQIKKNYSNQNPQLNARIDGTSIPNQMYMNHVGYGWGLPSTNATNDARQHIQHCAISGALTAGDHTVVLAAGCYDEGGQGMIFNYQGNSEQTSARNVFMTVFEIAG